MLLYVQNGINKRELKEEKKGGRRLFQLCVNEVLLISLAFSTFIIDKK